MAPANNAGLMQLALKIVFYVAVAYAAVVALAYFAQRKLTYFPSGRRVEPQEQGLAGVTERVLLTPDGEKVIAWQAQAQPGRPTILYFHGNGGNLASRAARLRLYQSRGYGMLMMSYRGYSGSTGTPTEAANVADAGLAYDALIGDGLRPEQIIVYGESLGSGVAAQLAAKRPVAGLILDAPFTSIVDVGARRYPFLPVRALMHDRYATIDVIGKIQTPLLIVHGERDGTVPFDMGLAVYAAAHQPKELARFPDAGHDNHYAFGSYEVIFNWLDRLTDATR